MQSYLKDKEYYDRKAKAAPLQEKDYCFVLQPKADSQGSKIPYRDLQVDWSLCRSKSLTKQQLYSASFKYEQDANLTPDQAQKICSKCPTRGQVRRIKATTRRGNSNTARRFVYHLM